MEEIQGIVESGRLRVRKVVKLVPEFSPARSFNFLYGKINMLSPRRRKNSIHSQHFPPKVEGCWSSKFVSMAAARRLLFLYKLGCVGENTKSPQPGAPLPSPLSTGSTEQPAAGASGNIFGAEKREREPPLNERLTVRIRNSYKMCGANK